MYFYEPFPGKAFEPAFAKGDWNLECRPNDAPAVRAQSPLTSGKASQNDGKCR